MTHVHVAVVKSLNNVMVRTSCLETKENEGVSKLNDTPSFTFNTKLSLAFGVEANWWDAAISS